MLPAGMPAKFMALVKLRRYNLLQSSSFLPPLPAEVFYYIPISPYKKTTTFIAKSMKAPPFIHISPLEIALNMCYHTHVQDHWMPHVLTQFAEIILK